MLSKFYSKICCQPSSYYPDPYNFQFGTKQSIKQNQLKFQSNQIITTKYNFINFLPKSILLQYKRLANAYFLLVAIIVTIPDISPQLPIFIWAPLIFVLMVSVVKEGYQDYKRYKLDDQINNQSKVQVMRNGQKLYISWKYIRVGDLCCIKQEEAFPADMFLINSSDPDGIAYISTASLDGQQTSKVRYSYPEIYKNFLTEEKLRTFKGDFSTQIPNPSLQSFMATIEIDKKIKLTMNDNKQLLFRGAKLTNTKWVWGLVVYSGQCSKILQNGQSFHNKFSHVQKKLNYLLLVLFTIQISICIIATILSIQYQDSLRLNHDYLIAKKQMNRIQLSIRTFLLFFLQFNTFIPISLIVSIEIVKLSQSYFIDFDQLMYSKQRKTKAYAKIAALNQELGQVQYVFTDKTGTLTQNKMKFHTAVIGDYQFQFTQNNKLYSSQIFQKCRLRQSQMTQKLKKRLQLSSFDGKERLVIKSYKELIDHYMMCLLICNNITVVQKEQALIYEGESPDQIAIMYFASSMGYKLIKRDKNNIYVQINDRKLQIKILEKHSFTSDRKRMSVIGQWDDKIILFIKGADNVITQRLIDHQFDMALHVDQLSRKGLRTLLCALRLISINQYKNMKQALDNASPQQKTILNHKFSNQFESQLCLIGATGLLDQLQVGVPEVLRDLKRAHIRVWMLTGDKLQTAVQIAKSCNLITDTNKIIQMRHNQIPILERLKSYKQEIQNIQLKYSLVIQGSMVNKILQNASIAKQFAYFTLYFQSVICCRLDPSQKSQLVKLIKVNLNKICLSIGDGGNDVPMIKQAHIGVGLYGEEGMNAVQASDYALPQFRMLWRLLFVHGRWNYTRISQMILYFAYKSVFYTITRVLFAFYNAFSGYPLYDDAYMALYNLAFTSMPLVIRALFEQDINYVLQKQQHSQPSQTNSILVKIQQLYLPSHCYINRDLRHIFPKLYYIGQRNFIFNIGNCCLWVLEAVILAIITFFMNLQIVDHILNQNGFNSSLRLVSITCYTSVIILVNIKIIVQIRHWTKLLLIMFVLTIFFYLGFIWFVNYFFRRPIQRTLIISFSTFRPYLVVILLTILSIAINILVKFIRFNMNKTFKNVLQQFEQMKKINTQLVTNSSQQKQNLRKQLQNYSSNQTMSIRYVKC